MSKQKWSQVRDVEAVDRAAAALNANGITVLRVKTGDQAVAKVLELVPREALVFTNTSQTTETIGLAAAINESGNYKSVRSVLSDDAASAEQKKYQGAAPEWMIGSVHAVTEDGKAIIASNTGSQLPGYSYGAEHVIWVVGTNKVVKDLGEAMDRLYGYTLPLETVRARRAYSLPDDWESFPSKVLIVNREVQPGRITLILIDEVLGF